MRRMPGAEPMSRQVRRSGAMLLLDELEPKQTVHVSRTFDIAGKERHKADHPS